MVKATCLREGDPEVKTLVLHVEGYTMGRYPIYVKITVLMSFIGKSWTDHLGRRLCMIEDYQKQQVDQTSWKKKRRETKEKMGINPVQPEQITKAP